MEIILPIIEYLTSPAPRSAFGSVKLSGHIGSDAIEKHLNTNTAESEASFDKEKADTISCPMITTKANPIDRPIIFGNSIICYEIEFAAIAVVPSVAITLVNTSFPT